MRIIHTADWHIGQTLAGYDRTEEHRHALAALARLAAEHEADALIVAGDVFDHQHPSGEALQLFYEALRDFKRARPHMTVIITAGNHDAAGRLEAPRPLLAALGVHVVGGVRRIDGRIDGARHLIPLTDASGRRAAEVLAVSYPSAACLPPLPGESDTSAEHQVARLYAELVEATAAMATGLPLIVTGHLHVSGGLESEGAERRILVGGQHAVSPAVFPEAAAYVALGHLHRPQYVGRQTVRYSGSLFPLSATEIDYEHGVTLVTLDGAKTAVRHLGLPRPVPFHRLPECGDMALGELADHLRALGLPADLPPSRRPFVQLCLARQGLPTTYRSDIDRIAESFPVRLLQPRIERLPHPGDEPESDGPPVRLADLQPEQLFRQAFARTHGADPEPRHLEAFHQAAAAAASED